MDKNLETLVKMIGEYCESAGEKIKVYRDEPMSRHTSFKVGGTADLYLVPCDRDALIELCSMIRETGAQAYFLGNGSNVIFEDEGYRGAVVSMSELNKIEVCDNEIIAESGATLASLSKTARDCSLTGLEFSYGIPGSVGGAVTMNAGAYGGEISHVLKASTYLDPVTMTVHTIYLEDHKYGYRESVYKNAGYVILSAVFELKHGEKEEIAAQMNDYMQRRVSKQPLEYPSAGSVFKRYPGRFTGQMIEEAGLKGYTIGGAQVSEKHAGFIINIGGATTKNIIDLIEYIKKVILEKFGCALECEVIVVRSWNRSQKK